MLNKGFQGLKSPKGSSPPLLSNACTCMGNKSPAGGCGLSWKYIFTFLEVWIYPTLLYSLLWLTGGCTSNYLITTALLVMATHSFWFQFKTCQLLENPVIPSLDKSCQSFWLLVSFVAVYFIWLRQSAQWYSVYNNIENTVLHIKQRPLYNHVEQEYYIHYIPIDKLLYSNL